MNKTTLHGWAWGGILSIFLTLAGLTVLQAQPAAADVRQAILLRLRQACVENPALRGVYVQKASEPKVKEDAKTKAAILILEGLVDRKEQAKLLTTEASKLIAAVPTWKAVYPGGVQTDLMKVFPIRSEYLPALKKELLRYPWPDEMDRRIFSQTRLDDVYYDPETGALTFAGVCISREGKVEVAVEIKTGEETPIRKKEEIKEDKTPKAEDKKDPGTKEPKKEEPPGKKVEPEPKKADKDKKPDVKKEDDAKKDDGKKDLDKKDLKKEPKKDEPPRKKAEDDKDAKKPDAKDGKKKDDGKKEDAKKDEETGWTEAIAFQPPPKGKVAPAFVTRLRGQVRLEKALTLLLGKVFTVPEFKGLKVSALQVQMLDSPVPLFQERFVKSLDVDSIFFRDAFYAEDGTLVPHGWVDEKLAKKVPEMFVKQFGTHPAVSAGEPKVAFQALKPITWPLDPRDWNARLAKSEDRFFQLTHVDRLYFLYAPHGEAELRVVGFYLANDAKALDKLHGRLAKEWQRDWPETFELLKGALHVYGMAQQDLRLALQRALFQKLKLKQAVLEDVRYSPDGTIKVKGFLGTKEEKEAFGKLLQELFGQAPRPRPYSIAEVHVEDWSARLKLLQHRLAKDEDPVLRALRVDGIWFELTDKDTIQAHLAGLSIHPDFAKDNKALVDRLRKEVVALAPALDTWPSFVLLLDEVQSAPRPDLALQARVAETPALDGVLIEPKAAFDGDGKLLLQGIWRDKGQERELRGLLESVVGKSLPRTNERGVVFQMEAVNTDKVLQDLRKFAAKNLEDARVERLYFDKSGQLRIKGIVTSKEDEKKLRGELKRLLKGIPGGQLIQVSGGRPLLVASLLAQPAETPAEDLKIVPSVAKHLRENVLNPKDSRWDGVLIERGIYDEKGKYILTGLLDSAEQKQLLDDALKDLSQQPDFEKQLEYGWSLDKMKVLPVQPMLKALRQGQPDFEDLDRLRFERAYHDTDKKLVITAFSTGANQAKAKTVIEELIKQDPKWKARAENGVRLELTPVPRNEAMAQFAVNKAIRLLQDNLPDSFDPGPAVRYEWAYWGCCPVLVARDVPAAAKKIQSPIPPQNVLSEVRLYLDVALFHDPSDTTAWFLRGATALAMGETAAAERDFRRTSPEINFPSLKQARLEKLQYIQGPFRQNATFLADRSVIIAAGGRRPPTLAEIVADSGK